MAKKTSKKPTAKKTTSKGKASAGPSKKPSEAHRILALWPPINDVQRGAFETQFSDERCTDFGAKTQSANVVKDALGFAHSIDEGLRKYPAALRRYGSARFVWLLECIVRLERQRDVMLGGKDDAAPARKNADLALAKAIEVRRDLAHALEMLTSDHPLDIQEIGRALGSPRTPIEYAQSLNDLAKLAYQWLRRTDPESKALVASVDLRQADVDLAWAAAGELQDAIERAAGKKVSTGRDTRDVNKVEGRVLLEMRHAMTAFAHARQINPAVPLLTPGPGTRAVLSAPKGKTRNGATKAPAAVAASPN